MAAVRHGALAQPDLDGMGPRLRRTELHARKIIHQRVAADQLARHVVIFDIHVLAVGIADADHLIVDAACELDFPHLRRAHLQ